ncbi:hypothetical protein [Novipirellula artificiosorum]|uniref:hypothetical protein n=1 Tax=Novipirellula artificiosorum TaxID=2528016 RepID=UPI0011B5C4BF|nr:hypothetical protein [Novipirellula artificiosorum]
MQIPEAAWGPEVNGLRAALVQSDVIVCDEHSVLVTGAVVVRNVTRHDHIRFEEWNSHVQPFLVENDQKVIRVEDQSWSEWYYHVPKLLRRTVLAPGEQCVLANPFSVGLFDVDAEENVKTSVKAYPFAQRIKSGRFQAFAQFTLQELAHEQRSRHRPSWEEIPPGGENSAKYRRRTSSWSEYVSLQTGRVAVDARFPVQIAESRKTAWQEDNALKLDGDATFDRAFCQQDGVLRLYFPKASYALAAFQVDGNGQLIVEGFDKSPALCIRTLIDTSGSEFKVTDLCTGNTVRLKPNAQGEWALADDEDKFPDM